MRRLVVPPWLMLVLAGTLTTVLLRAQEYGEQIDVALQNVDVVVLDSRGMPVHGLARDDFEILENNTRQPITHFAEYAMPNATDVPNDASGAAMRQTRRTIVFFVDEMSLHPATRAKLLKNAESLIATLRPDDHVLIATIERHNSIPVTVRPADAVDALRTILRGLGPVQTRVGYAQLVLERDLAAATTDTEQDFAKFEYITRVAATVRERMETLSGLMSMLAGIEGKKIAIVMTQALSAAPKRDLESGGIGLDKEHATAGDLSPLVRQVATAAAAAGVTIYCLQPDYGLSLAVSGSVEHPQAANRIINDDYVRRTMATTQMTLDLLSETTGGTWERSDGKIPKLFSDVLRDINSYYSLAYVVSRPGPTRAAQIRVVVKRRPDLVVRARQEVSRKTTKETVDDVVLAALLQSGSRNELAFGVMVTPVKDRDRLRVARLEVRIPLTQLTFIREDDDKFRAHFSIHVAGASWPRTAVTSTEQSLALSEDEYKVREGKTFAFDTQLRLPGGPLALAIGVHDPSSGRIGTTVVSLSKEQ
jgi:VWFA-related protein